MYVDFYPPTGYCNAAYSRPSPIDALTFSPPSINATMVIVPRSSESAERTLGDCCVANDFEVLDQCWSLCVILLPPPQPSGSRAVTGPPPDDLASRSLAARDLPGDAVRAFESCMSGKGVDIRGMNPKPEYRVIGTDGRTKPLESGGTSFRRGLSMTGLGLVGLVCLGLMI